MFRVGSDQARFQFAKAAIALRKSGVGRGAEETVVLAFGGTTNSGSTVHITRKVKKRPLVRYSTYHCFQFVTDGLRNSGKWLSSWGALRSLHHLVFVPRQSCLFPMLRLWLNDVSSSDSTKASVQPHRCR